MTATSTGPTPSTVFYDGGCALCHGFVRFVLARDAAGAINFAPLGGETFQARLTPAQRASLPDSICVLPPDGALLVRSAAVSHVLRRLGGFWRLCAALISWTPRPLADAIYDLVAANRRRLAASASACPMHPPSLSARLLP